MLLFIPNFTKLKESLSLFFSVMHDKIISLIFNTAMHTSKARMAGTKYDVQNTQMSCIPVSLNYSVVIFLDLLK